jgi:hypothetical protein
MNLLKTMVAIVGFVTWMCTSVAAADTARFTAFVTKTSVNGNSVHGGCMAALSEDPAGMLPACKSFWVTFSCDGTHTDPVRAYRMLDQAQLALATGMKVKVLITDAQMHNGYCFASQIDVISE